MEQKLTCPIQLQSLHIFLNFPKANLKSNGVIHLHACTDHSELEIHHTNAVVYSGTNALCHIQYPCLLCA